MADKDKHIVTRLIEYFTEHQVIGLTYAEALDAETVVQLNIMITNSQVDGDKMVPAKRISLLSCTEEDKALIRDVFAYLREQDVTGFDYQMDVPNAPQFQFLVSVRLTEHQIESKES